MSHLSTSAFPARTYRRYALLYLAATVLAGGWLRAALVRAEVLGPFNFGHAVHAHSHLAFFGWVSMALFGLLATPRPGAEKLPALARWHPHLVGVGAALAFVTFLLGGYSPPSIVLAAGQVLLWVMFVLLYWTPVSSRSDGSGTLARTAMAFLLVAGAGTVGPALAMARGVTDPWWQQLAVGCFLVPFVSGWITLGIMAVTPRDGAEASRPLPWEALLVATGTVPSILAHPAGAPPWPVVAVLGRVGLGLVGAGTAAFATRLLRAAGRPSGRWLRRLAGVSGTVAGLLQVLLALGVGASVAHGRPIVILYLHLVLLGFVTPVLMDRLELAGRGSRVFAGTYLTGLALMLAALGVMGVPRLVVAAARWHVTYLNLLQAALAGGLVVAATVVGMVVADVAPRGGGHLSSTMRRASETSASTPPFDA